MTAGEKTKTPTERWYPVISVARIPRMSSWPLTREGAYQNQGSDGVLDQVQFTLGLLGPQVCIEVISPAPKMCTWNGCFLAISRLSHIISLVRGALQE